MQTVFFFFVNLKHCGSDSWLAGCVKLLTKIQFISIVLDLDLKTIRQTDRQTVVVADKSIFGLDLSNKLFKSSHH